MGLGNNMSVGKAKGKSKSLVKRRRKEVSDGANLTMFRCGIRRNNHTDACAVGDTNTNTFFHDGVAAIPVVNDIVYPEQRAFTNNKMDGGVYKVAAGGKGSVSITWNTAGVVTARTNC
tara:strand:- start:813 stop:1166 length:354 start_codon:yes stop_codon:yes gene_type:complete